MAKLTKDQMLNTEIEQPTEEVFIPLLRGSVTLRGVTDSREYDDISATIRKRKTGAESGLPHLKELTPDEITRAEWISRCMIEPDLSFGEAIKLGRRIGPMMEILLQRIIELSGLTGAAIKQEEAAFEADAFPADVLDVLPGEAAPAAE